MNQKRRKKNKSINKTGSTKKTGLPPGSLVHIGNQKMEAIGLVLHTFDAGNLSTQKLQNISDIHLFYDRKQTQWLQIFGLHETELIAEIGKKLGLHPLILEDILNTGQRPKSDFLDDQLFFIMKTMAFLPDSGIVSDQTGFILKGNLLVSFHESELALFQPLYERLKVNNSRLRTQGSDYLLFALIDIIVDNYFPALNFCGEEIEKLEEIIFEDPKDHLLSQVQEVRKDLLLLKKNVFPLREALSDLTKPDNAVISNEQLKYFRDVYDHVLHIAETIETYRELNNGLKEAYMNALSFKMNQVMKTLTIIATIFIPLTFIVGVYGMNFEWMPELGWKYSYLVVWLIMLGIAGWMVFRFRKLKWM